MNYWLELLNDWLRLRSTAEARTLSLFEQLWNEQAAGKHISFVSVALDTSEPTAGDIKDLGMTIWSKRTFTDTLPYHWQVKEDVKRKDVTDLRNPDSFDFGTTQPIQAEDVRSILDDWVMSLSNQGTKVCLVLYGEWSLKVLREHWKPPIPVDFLDLEVIWRLQSDASAPYSFEEVASMNDNIKNATTNFNHAGNKAFCMLRLLQDLGKGKKETTARKFTST